MISPEDNFSSNGNEPGFDELADSFAQAIRRGEYPQIESYANDNPQHADTIRRLFPVLEMMERNGTPSEDFSENSLMEAELSQLNSTPPLRKLGDYRIVREIGRGGMGIVFEAYQESLGRSVALKLLPESAKFDDRRRQRFQQEALASAKLHHTNIVPVFGVGTHDDSAYFVMQFIDGQPLDHVLNELSKIRSENQEIPRTGSTQAVFGQQVSTIVSALTHIEASENGTPEIGTQSEIGYSGSGSSATAIAVEGIYFRNIADIGIQVSSALAHAHSRKTLHRDIKPSNLLIDSTGCVWVTDFGLAKYFESPDLTRTGEVVGTLRYMSPEQLNGKADERSDIFALGLTLYELACLKPAYNASDRRQLMQQVLEANPKRLRSVDRQIPKDLATIIHKCISNDPSSRYQSAELLCNDLRRFQAGEPVHARQINTFQRVAKWCRRRPAVASLIGALVVSLLAGIAGVSWQWSKTSEALGLANQNLLKANRQTEVAEEHFQQARDAVNRFFTVVSQQKLLQEPGFQRLRQELLQEALDYHQEFVEQYRQDDHLQFELAKSFYHISQIEGDLRASPEIADQLDEPIQILDQLAKDNPKNPEYELWLAKCLSLKANMLRRFDLAKSIDHLQNAIGKIESMLERHPEGTTGKYELAKNYQMLGLGFEQIERSTDNSDRSMESYTKAFLLRSELRQQNPDDVYNTIYLAETHRDLGISYRRKGDSEQAVEHYEDAMEILMPVVEDDPDNIVARASLGSIANTVGFFYGLGSTEEEYEKALSFYDLSREQYQFLSDRNPLVIQYKDGLARAALNAGGVHQVRGRLDEAIRDRKYGAEIREKLVSLNPNAPHIRSSWAISLNGVGATLRDMGQIEESIDYHQRAHEQHQLVVAGDQVPAVARSRLIDGILQMCRAYAAGQRFDEAYETIQSADEYIHPQDSRLWFLKGRECTILASKIGKLEDEQLTAEMEALLVICIDESKAALREASEQGFDVATWANRDTIFQNFSEYEQGAEILAWIESEFGGDN